jgi:methionine-rich copper-binding protein CopC
MRRVGATNNRDRTHEKKNREKIMSKIRTLMFLGAVSLTGLSSAAVAHPKLIRTVPVANAVVTADPSEIRLIFSERLEPSFSGAELKSQAGQKVETGKAASDPKDTKQLVIPLPSPLPAGTYSVNWHAVAADSHLVKGSFSFTVKR